jgi:Ca2+/Na+ antiporter
MKPQSIGRALGIGLRVAGRIAGQRLAGGAQAAASQHATATASAVQSRSAGQAAGKTTRGVAHGVGGFLRPFKRVGGILWLEVTGVFFFLFMLVFGAAMYRSRPPHLHGPYDKAFVVSAAMMLVFLYLGVTSFLSARRK